MLNLTVISSSLNTTFEQWVNPEHVSRFNRSVSGEPRTVVYMVDGSSFDVQETPAEILGQLVDYRRRGKSKKDM